MPNPNRNHPKKGSTISVHPIKKIKDIRLIKTMLKDKPRDYALFVLGINTNLRASDILNIKVHQVLEAQAGDELTLNEIKTKKPRRINLNKVVIAAIRPLLKQMRDNGTFSLNGPLFRGRKSEALTVPSLSRLVKTWCRGANLTGNYASHTLRKTWGYHQRKTFGVGLPELIVCFNHSSQRQTLEYLCIQPEEIKSVYENEL
jgi:integrase